MQAVVYEKYAGSAVLEVKEVDTPTSANSDILIKVLATPVTSNAHHYVGTKHKRGSVIITVAHDGV